MKCKCGSERVLQVSGKCNDMFSASMNEHFIEGYVPRGINIGSGDYLEFNLCLDCGQNQGTFPVTDEAFNEALSG